MFTRPGSKTVWTARISSRFARIARRTTPLLFCVPMLLTRLNPCVPILATTQVETVVLLSQQKPDDHIEIEINLDEIDATSAESKATYKEIEEWVQEHYGFHVTNLNIAQVKQKHGIIERENYNKPKSENSRQPGTTPEKEKAITEALKYFKMI